MPVLYDLFCGAGGASAGYAAAGFTVVGFDIAPQPHYPYEFHQQDALTVDLSAADLVHASPPCQRFSPMAVLTGREYPDLIEPTRALLLASGKPFVIENVPRAPIRRDLLLCGTQLGIQVIRHRAFELHRVRINALLPKHACRNATIDGRVCAFRNGGRVSAGRTKPLRTSGTDFRDSMECFWMSAREARQAIPPKYTEFIGGLDIRYD